MRAEKVCVCVCAKNGNICTQAQSNMHFVLVSHIYCSSHQIRTMQNWISKGKIATDRANQENGIFIYWESESAFQWMCFCVWCVWCTPWPYPLFESPLFVWSVTRFVTIYARENIGKRKEKRQTTREKNGASKLCGKKFNTGENEKWTLKNQIYSMRYEH